MHWAALLALLGLLSAPVSAEMPPRTAVAAEDGTTLRLADDSLFRLAGLLPPQPPLGYAGTWHTAERAREALEALAVGVPLRLSIAGTDRWGRASGSALLPDGRQLGAAMLAAGWVQLSGLEPVSGREGALRLEAEARAEGRGLWSDAYYAVRSAEDLPDELARLGLGRFLIVEGRVTEAAVVRGRAYLNFGPDWRSDFTATLSPDARRRFRTAGLDPRDYAGRRLRLRGWLESFNGPMIEIHAPDQIEVLEER